jgi:hypothetical protein
VQFLPSFILESPSVLRGPPSHPSHSALRAPPYALCPTLNFQSRRRAVCCLDIDQIGNTAQASSWWLQPCMRPEVLQKVVLVAHSMMAAFARSPFRFSIKNTGNAGSSSFLFPFSFPPRRLSTTRHPSCNVPSQATSYTILIPPGQN